MHFTAEQHKQAKALAERLANGETLQNKYLMPVLDLVVHYLKEKKNNCALVLRQIKEFKKNN